MAPFCDFIPIADGVSTKKIARYSTIKVGNISNSFGIGMNNVIWWRLNIAAHGALFINDLPIVDGGGIRYNVTDNIVQFIWSKYKNRIKHMSNLSIDILPMYSGPNL